MTLPHIVCPLTIIFADAVRPSEDAIALAFTIDPITLVDCAVCIFVLSVAVAFAGFEVSFIFGSILVPISPLSMSHIVIKFPVVAIPILIFILAEPMLPIIFIFSLIDTHPKPNLSSLPVPLVIFEIPFVQNIILYAWVLLVVASVYTDAITFSYGFALEPFPLVFPTVFFWV